MFAKFKRELELAQIGEDRGEKETNRALKSPPRSYEQWLTRGESERDWPPFTPAEGLLLGSGDRDSVLGSLEDVKTDLRKHSRWSIAKNTSCHACFRFHVNAFVAV